VLLLSSRTTMNCTTLCRTEYELVRQYMVHSWSNLFRILILPLLSVSILLVGIVGMVYQPRYVIEFSYLFTIGVAGTGITLFYTMILVVGSCIEPPPVLPLRNKGTVAV
jgi:hypothetical protein